MLFYIGFVFNVIGISISIYKTIKTRNVISPQIILFFGIFVYLYLPAVILQSRYIADDRYNAILMVGVLGAFVAARCFPYDVVDNRNKQFYIPVTSIFQAGAYIYIIYLLFQIFQAVYSAGGVMAAFRVNRLKSYLSGDMISVSLVINFLKEGLKIFFYYYFAILYENGKKAKAIILFAVPMIHHRFTAVTRYDFIAMATSLVLYLVYRKIDKNDHVDIKLNGKSHQPKKINVIRIAILGAVGVYFALIFMRVANFTRFGASATNIDLSFNSLLRSTVSNDSLYYEYFHRLYSAFERGEVEYEYGLSWFFYPIINFIPRALWSAKPYTAFSARLTDKIYWSLTSGNPVVTFSILGEGYAQFGIIGVFICSFVFLWVRWFNYGSINKMKYGQMYMLIIIMSLVTYMRSEAPVFYAIIDGLWLYIIRKTCCIRKNVWCK